MSKFFVIGLMFLLVVGSAGLSYADAGTDASSYRLDIGNKVERGFINLVSGWLELPQSIVDIIEETNNIAWGIFAGTFQGSIKAVVKTTSGICDIVTAPISPEKGPFISPDIDL